MAKLYFRYGAMGSSKTANAIMVQYNYEERGQKVLMAVHFFSIYFLFKLKNFLRCYPLKFFKNRMSDGTLRHFYAEVVSNCGSNHRKGSFLINCAATLHAL